MSLAGHRNALTERAFQERTWNALCGTHFLNGASAKFSPGARVPERTFCQCILDQKCFPENAERARDARSRPAEVMSGIDSPTQWLELAKQEYTAAEANLEQAKAAASAAAASDPKAAASAAGAASAAAAPAAPAKTRKSQKMPQSPEEKARPLVSPPNGVAIKSPSARSRTQLQTHGCLEQLSECAFRMHSGVRPERTPNASPECRLCL